MIQALLQRMPQLASYAIWEKPPAEAREDFRRFSQFAAPSDLPIGKVESFAAGTIPLRSYTPIAGSGLLPAIIYFHGGGFVLGDLDSYDALCRTLANESNCRVIAVDYRLAPEHPFPAAIEDGFAAVQWVEDHAAELLVDANHIAVAGDSAGGNLAAVVCQTAKQNKGAPEIAFQLLIYPALTMTAQILTDEEAGEPAAELGFPLDPRALGWFHHYYVPEGVDPADPRVSPLSAVDLSGLPGAYIVTAGLDPLRGDAIAYAERLKQSGVAVVQVDYPTMIHGFFSMQGLIPLASDAIAAAAHAVNQALTDQTA